MREWLEQQAASELLVVDDPRAEPRARRYWLRPEYIPVLADPDDLRYQAYAGVDIVRGGRWLPELVEAFRVGNAPSPLSWEPEGREEANRALYLNLLGTEWLPAIVDVDARLRAEPSAHALDVGCGTGWASIAMAQAYPNIKADGVDLDRDAIRAARRNAERSGVADRVTFSVGDAADLGAAGGYNLVTIFEALHDMSRPVDALRAARQTLSDDGTLLVADGLVADEFTVPASTLERFAYGWSVVSCLPGAMGDPQTAATGAVMRPSVLRQYALQAGFGEVEVLPIQTDYWRFYRLLRKDLTAQAITLRRGMSLRCPVTTSANRSRMPGSDVRPIEAHFDQAPANHRRPRSQVTRPDRDRSGGECVKVSLQVSGQPPWSPTPSSTARQPSP